MRNQRIFVSGGAGVIGIALVNFLLEEGADLFVGDLKACPKEWLGLVKYRQGDLNTITSQELLGFSPEIFFHLAATFERSEESYTFWDENFHHNVKLSHHLMHCLKGCTSLRKVVFASSYLIYDPFLYQFEQQPEEVIPLSENSPIYPRNICGAAKLFHELELRFLDQFLKDQVHFVAARIFRVYGKHSRDIISRWIRAALHQETLQVYRPEGRFDYILADDVAEGLIRLAKANFSGVVNLGSGHSRSVEEVLQVLQQHFPHLKIHRGESNILFEASQADIRFFQQVTNWVPSHTLETAIPKLIQFEQDQLSRPFQGEEHLSVLITSISKKVPLIQAIREATDKLGHFKFIHGCDSNPHCIGQYAVDCFWRSPSLDKLLVEDVIFYCQEHHIKGIIPTRDSDLEFYAKHLHLFDKYQICVMVSPLETINNCLDKKRFADVLAQYRFPVISTALNIEELPATRYVVKERYGAGSVHLGLNLSKEEAIEHSQSLKEPIFQPFIEGREWSVDVYRSFQGKVMGCVARKRDLIVKGESQITTTASYPVLERLTQEITQALNIKGHAIFQFIEDEFGNFQVIECNPRFGGASTASLAVGLDTFYWFFLECMDQSLKDYPFLRRQGEIRQVRYTADWILPWS